MATVLNLLQQAGVEPTLENIVGLNYLGDAVDLEDGEALAELEELFVDCLAAEEKGPSRLGRPGPWE